ncbi:MAG: hypothetical protein HY744_08045 [Deltaproteobacteria bacterium]|nr:hypothetical protein [Deltaproteobacteria bacterium]
MIEASAVHALHRACRSFGPQAARRKLALLRGIAAAGPMSPADLVVLQQALGFMLAYPDDARVRAGAAVLVATLRERVVHAGGEGARVRNRGLPGAAQSYPYHWGVVREMARAAPGCLEIDWDEVESDSALLDALRLVLPPAEVDGLEDDRLGLQEWLAAIRPRGVRTDLEVVLGLLAGSGLDERVQAALFDRAELPVRYALHRPGTGRCEVELGARRIHYQRRDIDRSPFPLEPLIREPLALPRPLGQADARRLLRASLAALCSRNLEIYPLIYAEARDVMRCSCRRGIEVVLIGTRPAFRCALESLYFFLVVKNGVPLAYGPAGVFLGACEMGINLFPEMRGAEIRFVYAQLMRVLRHVLGALHYFLVPYGMGEGNPEAIRSGAFWFYRRLGFRAESPRVEALARAEEERMRETPGYRSSPGMLRRLSHTRAQFDLSQGQSRPFDFGGLGLRLNRFVAERFGGDRRRAERESVRLVTPLLGAKSLRDWSADERAALAALAPLLAMVPELETWSAGERAALARAIRTKGGPSEAPAARGLARHPRFGPSLRALVAGKPSRDPPFGR